MSKSSYIERSKIPYKESPKRSYKNFQTLGRAKQQQGWILLEVLLCLVLLSVVMHLFQRQNQAQWASIQISEEGRKQAENQQRLESIQSLTGTDFSADSSSGNFEPNPYPECELCSGASLKAWFNASQHSQLTPSLSSGEP